MVTMRWALASALWLINTLANAAALPSLADAHAFIAQQLTHAEVMITAPLEGDHHFAYSGYRGEGCRSIFAVHEMPAAGAVGAVGVEGSRPSTAEARLIIAWQAISETQRSAEGAGPAWLELAGTVSIGGTRTAGARFSFADSSPAAVAVSLSAAMVFLRKECARHGRLLHEMTQQ